MSICKSVLLFWATYSSIAAPWEEELIVKPLWNGSSKGNRGPQQLSAPRILCRTPGLFKLAFCCFKCMVWVCGTIGGGVSSDQILLSPHALTDTTGGIETVLFCSLSHWYQALAFLISTSTKRIIGKSCVNTLSFIYIDILPNAADEAEIPGSCEASSQECANASIVSKNVGCCRRCTNLLLTFYER